MFLVVSATASEYFLVYFINLNYVDIMTSLPVLPLVSHFDYTPS